MKLAILTGTTMALAPELAYARAHDERCVNGGQACDQCRILNVDVRDRRPTRQFNPNTDQSLWRRPDGSHYSSAPRRNYVMVHHAGYSGSENNSACTACYNPPSYFYDFCIARNGSICDNGTWAQTTGGHAAGCNCNSIGVMMQGCYGGCSGVNLSGFNDAQLCSLAYLSLHLGTPASANNHLPHRHCSYWDPCASQPYTVCCGNNLCSDSTSDHWNAEGSIEMSQMLWMRSNLATGCNCTGQICP